ncbi:DUF2510 domain-containing protein [Pseudarthrobacter sp. P1]|uniref:DUF2510 domain-containing protein n=1 Tax=Pseudarthrobacter sp. P1 TaxID=3418418 RepID=UPI003CEDFEB7
MADHPHPGPIPPGWYPDPDGGPRERWWDGGVWTGHTGPTALQGPPAPRPQLGPQTPVYNPMIWLVVLLPLLALPLQLLWNPTFRFVELGPQHLRTLDPAAVFTPMYVVLVASGWIIYAASVVLAYFDWQALGRAGVLRPFHWAWAFLGAPVYVIGRSVIVHKVAPGRGLVPVWILIVLTVASVLLVGIKFALVFSTIAATLPR